MLFIKLSIKNIRAELMYKLNYFLGLFCISFVGIITILLVWIVTNRTNEILGWTFKEIVFLVSLWRLPHSFFIMFFLQLWGLDQEIRSGRFDFYFLRPRSIALQFFGSRFSTAGLGEFVAAAVGLIYSFGVIKTDFITISIFISIVIFGLILEVSIHLCISSTAFWTLQSSSLLDFVDRINFTLKQYPLNIYSKPIQFVITFILPFGFISYFPSHLILKDKHLVSFSVIMPYLYVPVTLSFLILSLKLWNMGLKKYEGSGT